MAPSIVSEPPAVSTPIVTMPTPPEPKVVSGAKPRNSVRVTVPFHVLAPLTLRRAPVFWLGTPLPDSSSGSLVMVMLFCSCN